jgi:hypothetical protein
MAEEFETWLHQLNEAFVTSTTASLDIEEALTIVKHRTARRGRSTEQPRVKRIVIRSKDGKEADPNEECCRIYKLRKRVHDEQRDTQRRAAVPDGSDLLDHPQDIADPQHAELDNPLQAAVSGDMDDVNVVTLAGESGVPLAYNLRATYFDRQGERIDDQPADPATTRKAI